MAKQKSSITLRFEAIGTQWTVELQAPPKQAKAISQQVAERIATFDQAYSRFRPDSWVSHIGKKPGAYPVPHDFAPMFELYQKLYQQTGGAVTPLIGEVMERAGYDANYSLVPKPLQNIPKLEDTLKFKGNTLHVKYSCVLDFGAAGKGYLVDIVGKLLRQQGISDFLIDAGGDMLHHSPAPTPVGLEAPNDTSQAVGVVQLDNQALCGSASNRRAWGDMHHIIDPRNLQPVRSIVATWVVADTAMLADGLATALFFAEPQQLDGFDFEYLVLKADNSFSVSKHFPGEVFREQST